VFKYVNAGRLKVKTLQDVIKFCMLELDCVFCSHSADNCWVCI